MSEFINTIDNLGDDVVLASLADKTITEFKDNVITSVGTHAFDGCVMLKAIDLPSVQYIGTQAFCGCENLTSAKLTAITTFKNKSDNRSAIGVFERCRALKEVELPKLSRAEDNAFSKCSSLETIYLPKATVIWDGCFNECTSLKTVLLPAVTNIGQKGLYWCTSLEKLTLPALTNINTNGIRGCTSLVHGDFPKVSTIGAYAFYGNTVMTQLILRNTSAVCTLSNTNALTDTPIASGTGYIYVPSALVDSYKSATNWSTYANQFRALEDYTVDGTTTGELDTTKI